MILVSQEKQHLIIILPFIYLCSLIPLTYVPTYVA